MGTTAWHLRNDGTAFPVHVHLYPMQDDDLASEAEVAAFLIKTKSKDTEYASYVLDAFMALRIENSISYDADSEAIDNAIRIQLTQLPFKFAYPLSVEEMLSIHHSEKNFTDVDTLYDFVDQVRSDISNIWTTIKDSFNQQFCRVRYGGEFQTHKGNSGIWFRIASVGYNWDNVIYVFTADIRRKFHIEYITICRDPESDYGDENYFKEKDDSMSYFYKAKDGTAYYYMPIDEFFEESHEKNPVFSATDLGSGVINSIKGHLRQGHTLLYAYTQLAKQGIQGCRDYRPYLLKQEKAKSCISASEWFEQLNTRTKMKLGKVKSAIKREYPEILDADIDFSPRENSKGNPVGFELIFTLVSNHEKIDNVQISIVSTKPLMNLLAESLILMFKQEYEDFIEYKQIRL